MTALDNAFRTLAAIDWKRQGKKVVGNADFGELERRIILEDLGKEGKDAIGLEFVGSKAYISVDCEGIFRAEKCPLRICREALAR